MVTRAKSAAHPHVCGEHIINIGAVGAQYGSSPRVWGAPKTAAILMTRRRLIPTCVGSTVWPYVGDVGLAAHPHVCGEHNLTGNFLSAIAGSSPRVWGAPLSEAQGIHGDRLIPTCVGSTP